MILVANERGGAKKLALHLMNTEDNDHVEVHSVSGFMSDNLMDAFHETYAVSKGTQCSNFFFSLILSPPEQETVSDASYLEVIKQTEKALSLSGQPRAIVFHEKKGRRHAHAVWSRIDTQDMKAINLTRYKSKVNKIAHEQFLKHGWQMPDGFIRSQAKDPTTFTVKEHYQAKRAGKNAREVKATLQDAWGLSDNKASYMHALRERGYWLARGDRRGYVVIDHTGNIYSVPKWTGLKVKDIQTRLGHASELQSIEQTKAIIAQQMTPRLHQYLQDAKEVYLWDKERLIKRRNAMRKEHRDARSELAVQQKMRWMLENDRRRMRVPRGLAGLWSRLNGQYKRIRLQNEQYVEAAKQRDHDERQELSKSQLTERRKLQTLFLTYRNKYQMLTAEIHKDIVHYSAEEQIAVETGGQERTKPQKTHSRRRRRRNKQHHEQDLEM